MNPDWSSVPLAELLVPVTRPEPVRPETIYRVLGAHWYAGGLYTKEVRTGAQIQARQVYRVQEGDFVYNRLFAWKGAFAIASRENDGCCVSNEFPCFSRREDRLDLRYLRSYFSRPSTWDSALSLSTGGTPTSRNRLKVEKLLSLSIPLPPLAEQRRIMARIDDVVAKMERARGLRRESRQLASRAQLAAYNEIVGAAPRGSMAEVAPLVRRPVPVDAAGQYPELGVRSFGKGTFHKSLISGAALGTKRIFRIEPGDLLFNIVFAWEGAVAQALPADEGRVGSHRFLTCVPRPQVAATPFLRFHFLTAAGLRDLGEASPGGAGRNRTLGIAALARIQVPLPEFSRQLWFSELLQGFDEARVLQDRVDAELDAMLPAVLDRAFRGGL